MSGKPRLLDLFCGAGGCTKGYQRAGFHVTGVDLNPQPRYCGEVFFQADALEFLRDHGREFDAIHASPPCQGYSRMPRRGREYPMLIESVRSALELAGAPWVIENVVGAPLRDPVTLCGWTFGLKTYRHRLFESSVTLTAPAHIRHPEACPRAGRRGIAEGGFISVCGHISQVRYARRVMQIDWMSRDELAQAIPPAYTEYIGHQLMDALEARGLADMSEALTVEPGLNEFVLKVAASKKPLSRKDHEKAAHLFRACGTLKRYLALAIVRGHARVTLEDRQLFDIMCIDTLGENPDWVLRLAKTAELEVEMFGPLTADPDRIEQSIPEGQAQALLALETPEQRKTAYERVLAIKGTGAGLVAETKHVVAQIKGKKYLDERPPMQPVHDPTAPQDPPALPQIATESAPEPEKVLEPVIEVLAPETGAEEAETRPFKEWEESLLVLLKWVRSGRVSGHATVEQRKQVSGDVWAAAVWAAEGR